MRQKLSGILLVLFLLLLWELMTGLGYIDTPSFPPVSKIVVHWYQSIISGKLPLQMFETLKRMFIGYGLAIAIAVPIGLLMGMSKFIFGLLEPITELLRPIPSAAYVPVAILFFGIGDEMKIFVIFMACFFPILLNTYGGVKDVDPVLIDTGRTFGYSENQVIIKVIFPAVRPYIFTGMRISLGIALIVAVVAEMIASNSGIGYFILDAQRFFRVPEMFAGIFSLAVVGYLLNVLFMWMENRVLRWRTSGNQ